MTLLSVILLFLPMNFLRLLLTPLLFALASNAGTILAMSHIIYSLVVLGLSLLWLILVVGTATSLELDILTLVVLVPSEEWSEVTPSLALNAFFVLD